MLNSQSSSSKISVILPTYNEAGNIVHVMEDCLQALTNEDCEIIVVDDNSEDGTADRVREFMQGKPVRIHVRKYERGLVSAIREGIQLADGKYCFWMDADGSMSPALMGDMLKQLRSGADLTWGSRFIPGGAIKGANGKKTNLFNVLQVWMNMRSSPDSFVSTVCSRLGNWLTKRILSHQISDYSSGFFGARKELLEDVGVDGKFVDYCANLTYMSLMKGYTLREVPMTLEVRRFGVSKTSSTLPDVLKMGWQCFANAIRLRLTVPDRR